MIRQSVFDPASYLRRTSEPPPKESFRYCFAPTDAARNALPAGTVDNLLKPENMATLTKILTYHVVAGKYDSKAILGMIRDDKGNTARATIADVYQSNGVIMVIDKVLMP